VAYPQPVAANAPPMLPVSHQLPQRPEVQVQVLVLQAEGLLQLLHPLLEEHERLTQPLDLLRGERPALDPPERLALHELAEELHQRQHELRQPLLEVVAVGVDPPAKRAVQAVELAA